MNSGGTSECSLRHSSAFKLWKRDCQGAVSQDTGEYLLLILSISLTTLKGCHCSTADNLSGECLETHGANSSPAEGVAKHAHVSAVILSMSHGSGGHLMTALSPAWDRLG